MKFDAKTHLKEGMKIAPIDDQDKEYTLVVSNSDNKMYAVNKTHIIKLDDMNENELDSKWICTDISTLQEEILCIEFENGKIVSFDDFCIYKLSEIFYLNSDDFTDISMKEIRITREEYNTIKGLTYYIKLRNSIAEYYEKQYNKKA